MKKIVFIAFSILLSTILQAQQGGELRCNVNLETSKIQGTNKRVFQTLQTALYEFMNNRTWGTHVYLQNEKIECTIMIIINEVAGDEYKASVTVQLTRPVFGSSYKTTLLNYIDNYFTFSYVEYQSLEFNETQFLSNLTSTMAFYAYIILGIDYDSFGFEGGSEFFKKAETITNNASNSSDDGWKPFIKANKNRYWLIKNIMDKNYQPCREFMYKYHRLGLDNMAKKQAEARIDIASSIESLKKVYQAKPDAFMHLLQVIFDAKADEFVNIFSEGMPEEKSRVSNMLLEINPTNATKYDKIMKQKAGI